MQKITLVAGIHGSERAPVDALKKLGIPFVLGNPKALTQGVRFIEQDLNRVFGEVGNSWEHTRAKEILSEIPGGHLVVDLHTASKITEPFAIIVDLKIKMIILAKIIGIKKVIYIPKRFDFITGSLIHSIDGIVVECGGHEDVKVFNVIEEIVKNCQNQKFHEIEIYEVVGRNCNSDITTDFTEVVPGLYTVLTGAKSHRGGFLARLLRSV
jgi:hypothetical protein